MKYRSSTMIGLAFVAGLAPGLLSSCNGRQADASAEAPPPAEVEHERDGGAFKVDHPEQFTLATASEYSAAPELNVTGSVSPDVSRNIPVISIASGRVVEIRARLGDTVTKGQILMRIQSADIAQAFSDYRQAVADETLARTQLERSKLLYEHGAVSLNDFQVAQDAEAKAQVTVETTIERLRVLGADINHPAAIVDIRAPASGVITDQQVTNAAGVQGLAGPNPFTISDLSHVWVMCDVYENDLSFVRLGEYANIHLNAYPDLLLKGRIGNIGPILDPNLRTAKVRLEVENPGMLRLGMFVTATFYGMKKEVHATVPASAVLHLHDRDWVYVPIEGGRFQRVEVIAGKMLPAGAVVGVSLEGARGRAVAAATPPLQGAGQVQEITSGLRPGQQVVANALMLQASVEQ
ncbi:MAG TPA: efflux RND transporter periplasmic adaptor subunit [Candidatus Sulfotelmatobacter sp.]|nr:efflux RND transporter periplasmic adaptor subunit [Candidatus Sulfotelmatobacter sp.]